MSPSPKTRRRFFLCTGQCVTAGKLDQYPESHIIGELRYVSDEGRKVSALARYEVSVSSALPPLILPELDGHLIGDARNCKCRYPKCERKFRWEIGKAGYLVLTDRYQNRQLEPENQEMQNESVP